MELQETVIPYIGKASKLIRFHLRERLEGSGIDLTSRHWIVLYILHMKDGRSQQELALVTDRNKASLVRLLDSMEAKKLVERRRDEDDRRINRIFISKYGREQFRRSQPVVQATFSDLQRGLSKEEISKTIQNISTIIENISGNTRKD